ncbi:MAG: DUF2806 domain-containing protein [Treponema sp.]|nr:DUF2806 domain-containing protein [Treponema sp.]
MSEKTIKEVVAALKEPAKKKFVELVQACFHSPELREKQAAATAYEINTLSKAVRDNIDLPVVVKDGKVSIDTTDTEALIARTTKREHLQSIHREQNIESIFAKTATQLESVEKCSSEPVNPDLLARFIEAGQDVSDDDLQNLWAKILAGEIVKPKTCSLRTIDILKNMSKDEFDMFLKVCPFVMDDVIFSDSHLLLDKGITTATILILDECGLLIDTGLIRTVQLTGKEEKIFNTDKYILLAKRRLPSMTSFFLTVYPLTESGRKLYSLSDCNIDNTFFLAYSQFLVREHRDIEFRLHRITNIETDGSIEYDKTVNLLNTPQETC